MKGLRNANCCLDIIRNGTLIGVENIVIHESSKDHCGSTILFDNKDG